MFGADQSQTVGQYGIALQATGGITLNINVSEDRIRGLVQTLLVGDMPNVDSAAKPVAEANVRALSDAVVKEMGSSPVPLSGEKLNEPDVQLAFNDAVRAAARRGEGANLEALAKLLTHRLESSITPFVEIVIAEAIQAVPKLTKQQLSFLLFVFSLRSVSPSNAPARDLETLGQAVWPLISKGFGLSPLQRSHLQYAGTISVTTLLDQAVTVSMRATSGIMQQLYQKHGVNWGTPDAHVFAAKLESEAPTYFKIAQKWEEENGQQCELTSVGSAIALAMLLPVVPFPGMSFEDWIK